MAVVGCSNNKGLCQVQIVLYLTETFVFETSYQCNYMAPVLVCDCLISLLIDELAYRGSSEGILASSGMSKGCSPNTRLKQQSIGSKCWQGFKLVFGQLPFLI